MRFFTLTLSSEFTTTSIRQLFSFLISFTVSICIAKALGPSGNGAYVAFTTVCGLSTLLSSLGTHNYIGYVSAKNIFPDSEIISGILAFPLLLMGLVIVCCIAFSSYGAIPREYIPFLGIVIISGIVGQSCLSFLQSKGDIFGYNFAVLVSPTILACFCISVFFYKNINTVLIGYTIGESLFSFIVVMRALQQSNTRPHLNEIKLLYAFTKSAISYGIKSQFILLTVFLMYRSAVLFLASLSSPKEVGTLGLALSILEKTWFFGQAASIVFFKRMASHDFTNKHLDRLAKKVGIATSLCALALLISIKYLWHLLGPGYSDLFSYALILAPGIIAAASSKIYINRVLLTNISNNTVIIFLFLIVTVSVMNYIAITLYQSYGAAAGISIGYALYFFTTYYVTHRKL